MKKKKEKKLSTPYDHIRKPIPKKGFAFKDRKNALNDRESKKEMSDYD